MRAELEVFVAAIASKLNPRPHVPKFPAANRIYPRNIELKEDTVIVVLGASGDLAKKKTVCILCA